MYVKGAVHCANTQKMIIESMITEHFITFKLIVLYLMPSLLFWFNVTVIQINSKVDFHQPYFQQMQSSCF